MTRTIQKCCGAIALLALAGFLLVPVIVSSVAQNVEAPKATETATTPRKDAATDSVAEKTDDDDPLPVLPQTKDTRKQRRARDPFWPVGYQPKDPMMTTNGPPDWSAARAQLKIQNPITAGNRVFAMIDGKIVSAGENVTLTYGPYVYTWQVADIQVGKGVKLKPLAIKSASPE
jgi:hypothetical protein